MCFLHACLDLGLPCPMQPHPDVGVLETLCVGAGVLLRYSPAVRMCVGAAAGFNF